MRRAILRVNSALRPLLQRGDSVYETSTVSLVIRPTLEVASTGADIMSLTPGHAQSLLADRLRRWRSGQRILSEDYFALYPAARQDPNLAVEVIHQEYRLLLHSGAAPTANDFLTRFPEFAGPLSYRLAILPERIGAGAGGQRPRLIGRFVLRRPLGESERGVLYKAYDARRGKKVAVRVLRLRREQLTAVTLDSLRQELPRAARLNHPNVCRLFGLKCGGEPYLVREYIRGLSLADWLRQREKARKIRRAVTLIAKVTQGLAAIHDAGLTHRNIKPSNVLLDASCEPHLSDMDLIPLVRCPRMPVGAGTPARLGLAPSTAYLAPEQTPEYAAPVGPAADVYSLAVVTHQLLTGVLPDGNPPLYHRPDLDPMLERILKQALARRPQDRIPNGREFAAALGTWLKRKTFC